jgi:predicted alpha/beta-fold hydrolase
MEVLHLIGTEIRLHRGLLSFLIPIIWVLVWMWRYFYRAAAVPKLYFKAESAMSEILANCSHLHDKYYPPLVFSGAHAQTVAASLFRPKANVQYKRELFPMPDGGTLAFDWLRHDERSDSAQPGNALLVVLHGVTGGSNESYVTHICDQAHRRGWDVVVVNARGCAGSEVTSRQFYCGAWTDDIRIAIREFHGRTPRAPMFAAGFSLGANILTKYLGEEGAATPLTAAVALANPMDLEHGSKLIARGFARLAYNTAITRRLRAYVQRHAHMMPAGASLARAVAAKSLLEFDEAATAAAFGYSSAMHYYRDASSGHKLGTVGIPLLLVSAADDPIAPPQLEFMRGASEFVAMAVTARGGHVAWCERGTLFRTSWADRTALQFLDVALSVARGRSAAYSLASGYPFAPC